MPRPQPSPVTHVAFRLTLLGSWRLERDGAPQRVPALKARALLAYLALHPEAHSREKIAALFWGDSPDAEARLSLRVALTALRKLLGDAALLADRATLQLNPDFPLWLDAREFRNFDCRLQIEGGGASQHEISTLQSAMDLYRGDLLAEFYDDWIMPLREQLRAQYLETLVYLTQHYRSQSDYARAVEFAQRALATDPAHERAHQHLMFCQIARGDRTAALEQYAECERALREELNVAPAAETRALYEWIQQDAPRKSFAARITNLPLPLTSFVGRQNETRDLKALLARARLVTLTGVGGSGKTRLAIQVATDLIDHFHDGVWWVAFEALCDPTRVTQTIAATLGVRQAPPLPLEETLRAWLGERELLLVLDNCEHLVEPCAELVAALLRHCPRVRVLATSREPFRLAGEVMWQAPPLSLPGAARSSVQHQVVGELARLAFEYEAIRLFVERAAAVRRDFQLNDANTRAVIEICRRLDGIPLAIELAAARVNALTVHEIAARLDDRFRLLTDGSRAILPRQQTLRALIDWSFDLLAPAERALFCQLAVFAGGWTLRAAEAVCRAEPAGDGEPSILDLLARLIAKSLVISEPRGETTRYRMLETIREYARARLTEMDAVAERHAHFFLAHAEPIAAELKKRPQPELLDDLETEHENSLAALDWALAYEPESALRLANALGDFWALRGYWNEKRKWLERVLTHPALTAPTRARATALNFAGASAVRLCDWTSARDYFEATLAIARALEDHELVANVISNLGVVAMCVDDWTTARARHHEALAMRRALGKPRAIAISLNNLGIVAKKQGDYAAARAYYQEALAVHGSIGNRQGMAMAHGNLGTLALQELEFALAREHVNASLTLARELGDKNAMAMGMCNLGRIALGQKDWNEARAMSERAYMLLRDLNDRVNLAAACYDLGYALLRLNDAPAAERYYAEGVTHSRAVESSADMLTGLRRFANLALSKGNPARAARLLSAVTRLSRTVNVPANPFDDQFFGNDLARARAKIDAETFAAAWAAGDTANWDEAIEYALGSSDQ